MKCRYKHCLHTTNDINITDDINSEDFVKIGKMTFHKDCLQAKNNANKIAVLFAEKINPNVVHSQLNAVINNILFKKLVPSDFLLFGLEYYIKNNIPLNYPQGLYYVIQNKDVKKEYDKIQAQKIKEEMKHTEFEVVDGQTFTYQPVKKKGFGDILGDK